VLQKTGNVFVHRPWIDQPTPLNDFSGVIIHFKMGNCLVVHDGSTNLAGLKCLQMLRCDFLSITRIINIINKKNTQAPDIGLEWIPDNSLLLPVRT